MSRKSFAVLLAVLVAAGAAWLFLRPPQVPTTSAVGAAPPTSAEPAAVPGLGVREDGSGVEGSDAGQHELPLDGLPPETWSGTRTLRVVSAAADAPIEGALVRVTLYSPRGSSKPEFREGSTGPDGSVVLPATTQTAGWTVRKRGFVTALLGDDDMRVDKEALRGGVFRSREQVRLVPAPSLAGRVVLTGGDEPVAGARVNVWFSGVEYGRGLDEPQVTDAGGAFELAGVPVDRYVRLAAAADGFASALVPLSPGERPSSLRIVLGRGAELSGTVRDGAGKPVADAEVFAAARGAIDPLSVPYWRPRMEFLRVRAVSDGNGRFSVRGLSTPAAYVLSARTAGGAIGHSEPIDLGTPSARVERDVAVAATGSLVVTARAGARELPEEELSRVSMSCDAAWSDADDAKKGRWSAAEGAWTLNGVTAGPHRVYFDAWGFVPTIRAVEIRPGQRAELSFDLDRGVSLSGKLVDAAGKPIAGQVGYWTKTDDVYCARYADVPSSGRWRLEGLPPVGGTVWARVDGYEELERKGVVPGTGGALTLTLSRGAVLRGTWPERLGQADLLTGSQATVGYVAADGESRSYGLDPHAVDGADLDSVYLPTGAPFLVYVRSAGRAPIVRRDVLVPPGGTLDLGKIEFPEPHALRGIVRDAKNSPVVGARVSSIDAWSDAESWTDASGAFRLTLLPPGPTTFAVEVDNVARVHVTVDVREREETVDIAVSDPGKIVVAVKNPRGEPEVDASFNLAPVGENGSTDWRRRVIVRTDSLGRLEARTEPGRYRLEPHSSLHRAWKTPFADFVVASGVTLSFDLVLE